MGQAAALKFLDGNSPQEHQRGEGGAPGLLPVHQVQENRDCQQCGCQPKQRGQKLHPFTSVPLFLLST